MKPHDEELQKWFDEAMSLGNPAPHEYFDGLRAVYVQALLAVLERFGDDDICDVDDAHIALEELISEATGKP